MPDIWMDVDAALSEVPVNVLPLIDDTDFKTIEGAVAYNAAGMSLFWHFVTSAGAYTVTAVTPTTAGDYDWTDQGSAGIYTIEIPASGGASINNDTEGYGWFTGVATGVLPWRGPVIGFRAAGLNDLLCDSAFSTTRGLSGTALPNAAAEAAGGLYTRGTGAGQINQNANGQVDARGVALSTNVITAAATDPDFGTEVGTAVWATTTRVLTANTNLNDLSAAGVRSAIGLGSANLDTQLGDLPTNAELATALGTADDAVLAAIAALNNISVANILAATIEGSTTLVQSLRLLNAACGGLAAGLETATATYRDLGDTKDRITATVDADGNRTAVTLDLT